MSYRNEQWFAQLNQQLLNKQRKEVAAELGISAPALSQVLNGSGKYGSGQASTARIAERVLHAFGRYECPYLTEQEGATRLITGDECRVFAHRPPPVGSPRDMQHWQACNACHHKAACAPPPPPQPPKPRKPRASNAPQGES